MTSWLALRTESSCISLACAGFGGPTRIATWWGWYFGGFGFGSTSETYRLTRRIGKNCRVCYRARTRTARTWWLCLRFSSEGSISEVPRRSSTWSKPTSWWNYLKGFWFRNLSLASVATTAAMSGSCRAQNRIWVGRCLMRQKTESRDAWNAVNMVWFGGRIVVLEKCEKFWIWKYCIVDGGGWLGVDWSEDEYFIWINVYNRQNDVGVL